MTGALQRVTSTATQTTQIEQARATADVLAAMEAAKRWPRDEELSEQKMRAACQRQLVADKAFWSFKRSSELLTGSTIHLARTIGAIWTNFQWGIAELSRDDRGGESQMIAWAWDLETNTRNSTAFVVPHWRDTKNGRKKITELRDIYENNANNGARRVRQMITDLLPDWYVETAEDTCRNVIEGSDQPIEKIRAEVGAALKPLGIELPRVLARVGRTAWNETTRGDLATLRIIAKTIARGEATAREQFPDIETREAITVREATERAPDARPLAAHVERAAPAPPAEPERLAKRTHDALMALFGEAGIVKDRPRRLRLCEIVAGLDKPLTSTNNLSEADGRVIEAWLRDQADQVSARVRQLLDEDDAARAADAAGGVDD